MSALWRQAQAHLAGGVNSPVRAFQAVGGKPIFIRRGKGAYIFDNRSKRYTDFCLSWGALIFGHADPQTIRAITSQAQKGSTFGTATEYETQLAMEIKKAFPGMERIRFTSSGTEAAMSAIRLARGITQKNRVVKFEGCYHGHSDGLLVKAGSGLATFGTPTSAGVPKEITRLTSVLPYNDTSALESFFARERDIACAIVEPIAANMGAVPATHEFLETLRRVTRRTKSLLIFDEVISGYRVAYGGAQHLYGIKPDLTLLGKIIGGGLPIGAFGASARIMNYLSPKGKVYQAGTLSGNPLSMVAGHSVLSRLSKKFYSEMNERARIFTSEALKILRKNSGGGISISQIGGMFTVFFSEQPPKNFKEACQTNPRTYARLFKSLLKQGVYFPPSSFEACFISEAHRQKELDKTLGALYHTRL